MAGGKGMMSDDEDDVGIEDEERDEEEPIGDEVGNLDDDEEDEEEGQDEYEKDGFIVDDVDEEEVEEERIDSDERQKKKRKKKRETVRNFELDEDDYELLQESNISVPRPKLESKKFKRLKKARGNAEGESSGFSDDEEFDVNGTSGHTAEEKVKRSLFGDDDGQPLEDIAEEDEPVEDEDIGDEDDMADFIVEEDYVDEHGAPVRKKKPKKSRQHPGVSSSALQEAHEIFGDVDDLLRLRKLEVRDSYGETVARSLEDQFDPSVLSEKYMTGKDGEIREIDAPERMQMSEESTGDPPKDETSIQMEADWIHNQLVTGLVPLFGKGPSLNEEAHGEMKHDIARCLELMHIEKLDVPFMGMYRKEQILNILKASNDATDIDRNQKPTVKWHKLLWAIKDLDERWLLLEKRKSALLIYCSKRFEEESRRVYDETRLNLNSQIYDSTMASLKSASSEREVDDVDLKFNLHFPPGEVVLDEGQYKRPKRTSRYSICNKGGLWEVGSKFCYSAEIFGKLASLEKVRTEELEDPKETPEEMASNFTSEMFPTPEAVLKGTRHMAAVEISCEPRVRKHVRSIFMDEATVTTIPTSNGNTAIDSFHQFAEVKWLKKKPLFAFEDAQWLKIQKAEEEKLLQVTISLPESVLKKLLTDAKEYYLSDGVSKSAQLWNEQRTQIIEDAFYNFLFPSMEKEARSLLNSKAKTWLAWEYGKSLWDKVSVAPYPPKGNDVNSDEEAAARVMACCWGPGKPATTFVMLDSSGEVLDVLHAGSLNLRGRSVNEQQSKKNDQQRVQKFMMDHQPHIVVLGAANLYCTKLKDDIYEVIFKMVEDNPRDVGHEMDNLNIVYGDESLPHLYENSRVSVDQLPSQEGIIRRAVALGRYLQNPLAMAATLCGPGREILSWKLHPLENFLTPDEKYEMVEQVMVDITNQVGLDLNLASSHEWLFAPLQFISGLGPRKAASLQRSLIRSGPIFKRSDLMFTHGLGKNIFINAAGFLRVRPSGLASISTQFMDLLDDTRIHPQSYQDAVDFAKDILQEHGDYGNDDLGMAVEYVRDKPDTLKSIDIQEYAELKGKMHIKETLNDIRLELIEGFQERRKPYEELNQDDEFFMISGEAKDSLSEGRVVQATVRKVEPQKAICVLESGLDGILHKEDYDRKDSNELTDKLHPGDILTCWIKSINKHRYQVYLTCKEGERGFNRFENNQNMDPYYNENHSALNTEQDKSRKEKELAKRMFKPRMIVHPRFQNITADEAVQFLSKKAPGESVVRPSSHGPLFLTITLKIYDDVYAHKDISESGKEQKDITSLLRIGKKLKIGEDTFEDLDEVMDRYVDPLVAHLKTMLNYRKFRKGSKAEVDELLRSEKAENPMRIVYCFGVSHEHPGTFILSYIRSSNPHHEYIGLYPKGFKFRKRVFEDIDRLVAYFQRHIDDPLDSAPSIRSVAAMVPMRSPATGGSSGFGGGWGGSSNNDDWRGHQNTDRDRGSGRNDGSRPRRGRGRDFYGGDRGGGHDSRYGSHSQKWGSKDSDSGGGMGWSSGGKVATDSGGGDGGSRWGGWGSGGDRSENGGDKHGGTSGWGSGGGGW